MYAKTTGRVQPVCPCFKGGGNLSDVVPWKHSVMWGLMNRSELAAMVIFLKLAPNNTDKILWVYARLLTEICCTFTADGFGSIKKANVAHLFFL